MIIFLPKAWDVILNPITGRVSDRFITAHGSRRPFLTSRPGPGGSSVALVVRPVGQGLLLGQVSLVRLFQAAARRYRLRARLGLINHRSGVGGLLGPVSIGHSVGWGGLRRWRAYDQGLSPDPSAREINQLPHPFAKT